MLDLRTLHSHCKGNALREKIYYHMLWHVKESAAADFADNAELADSCLRFLGSMQTDIPGFFGLEDYSDYSNFYAEYKEGIESELENRDCEYQELKEVFYHDFEAPTCVEDYEYMAIETAINFIINYFISEIERGMECY